jgi:hypothetical protein
MMDRYSATASASYIDEDREKRVIANQNTYNFLNSIPVFLSALDVDTLLFNLNEALNNKLL